MNPSQKNTLSIEEISKLIRDAKFHNPSVHEKFDTELFILGFLSGLQCVNSINRVSNNLEGLVSLRNLEAINKITTQEKLDIFQGVLNLTESPLNNAQLSSFQLLPEKWSGLNQTSINGKNGEKSLSPGISHKRSKSIEGKLNIVPERTSTGNKPGVCYLCGNEVKGINQIKIQSCGHILHDNCLKLYLYKEVNKKTYPILCPLDSCRKELAPVVLQSKLDSDTLKRFWHYAFTKHMKKPDDTYSWCPTQGCDYFYITPKPMLMMFRCQLCQKHYCLNCKTEYHKGQSCDAYQKNNNIQPAKLEKDLIRFKQCPKCSKWAEYENSQDLKCACGYDFCMNCSENPSKCSCEEIEEKTNGHQEMTHLYKMIMQDQEHENARLKENYKGNK